MKTLKPLKIKSWSLSAINKFEQCPREFHAQRTAIEPQEKSWYLLEGIRIHDLMEHYLLGDINGVPPDLIRFKDELMHMKAKKAVSEEMLVMDKEWNFMIDGWQNSAAWWRGKTDARIDNFIVDLKTGQHYPEQTQDQAHLYSIALFKAFPKYKKIDVEFWYSKTGNVVSYTFHRKDLKKMIAAWMPRVKRLFSETEWLPTPHEYCKYCLVKDSCPAYPNE